MTPAEANAEAARWTGFARALSRRFRVPPLYTREDWEAEALLGLAKALATMDRDRPGTHPLYVERVVTNHLRRCIRAVLTAPKPAERWYHRRNEVGTGGLEPPRSTYAEARRMDETLTADGESLVRHEVVANVTSPDPLEAAHGSALLAKVRKLVPYLNATERQALGFLLRGLEVDEVAAVTGRTVQAETDRRYKIRRLLTYVMRQEGYAC